MLEGPPCPQLLAGWDKRSQPTKTALSPRWPPCPCKAHPTAQASSARPESGGAPRSCVGRGPGRCCLTLTCVDTGDDVSFLRPGAVWNPRLLPLFQPGDQVWLGDGVPCHGENQRAVWLRPQAPASSSVTLSSPPPLPGPALPPPCITLENSTLPSLEPCPESPSSPAKPIHPPSAGHPPLSPSPLEASGDA